MDYVEILIKYMEKNCEEDILDEEVYEASASMASEANNGGFDAQLTFLGATNDPRDFESFYEYLKTLPDINLPPFDEFLDKYGY